jgi:hypothetical protein
MRRYRLCFGLGVGHGLDERLGQRHSGPDDFLQPESAEQVDGRGWHHERLFYDGHHRRG